MSLQFRIVPNQYRDSVALMQLAAGYAAEPGIEQVAALMATAGNLDLLRETKLLPAGVQASASDILIVVSAKSAAAGASVLERAAKALAKSNDGGAASPGPGTAATALPRSLAHALTAAPTANLALISVPGEYAAIEAHKALDRGLHVMLFSDNVAVADEIALKAKALVKKRLMMGPDCGTAIIDGVPLGFANVVPRGAIGVIGASGTGLQQVTSLIAQAGAGISQAIGTGGRDLSAEVRGATARAALARLAADPATNVIVLVGKPPAPAVASALLAQAAKAKKPVIVNFIGWAPGDAKLGANLHVARTLADAAAAAVALADGKRPARASAAAARVVAPRFVATQRYIRGLYSGGTFCYEASMILGERFDDVWSNASVRPDRELADPWKSRAHTLIDLGDDVFTRGRPHPMIDHRLRNDRIVAEAADPSVAVILVDVVLGHGSHADPVAAMLPALEAAQARAKKARRTLAFVGFVCGTSGDPQGLARQTQVLRDAGVLVAPSNAAAVALAARLVASRQKGAGR